jgi:hypothetical protein
MRKIILSPKDIERFWSKVDRNGPVPVHRPELGPCWLWQGARFKKGYGRFHIGSFAERYSVRANRVAWFISCGTDPGEGMVCHHCDNPPCSNPKHLFLGTNDDNMKDKMLKGRQASGILAGVRNGRAKINELDVVAIRTAVQQGETQAAVARRFGLSTNYVTYIIHKRRWKHVLG